MKRSEIIDHLTWYLEERYNLTQDDADNILNFLERQGMLPPPVRVFKESTVLNQETGEWETGKISCTVNEWEPEE